MGWASTSEDTGGGGLGGVGFCFWAKARLPVQISRAVEIPAIENIFLPIVLPRSRLVFCFMVGELCSEHFRTVELNISPLLFEIMRGNRATRPYLCE